MKRFQLKGLHYALVALILIAGVEAVESAVSARKLPYKKDFTPDYPTIDQLTFSDLSKGKIAGDTLLGQAVLIVFFDPGCAKCTGKLPAINKVYETFKGEGVTVIGMSSSGGGLQGVASSHSYSWVWASNTPIVKKKLQSAKTMEMFLFDRLGRIAYKLAIEGSDWTFYLELALGSVVERALDLSGVKQAFVGSAACGMCHQKEYEQWLGTPHARALETLAEKGNSERADCRSCHVTGEMGAEKRAWQRTPSELREVGCEECHGPGGPHRTKPYAGARTYSSQEESCLRCHDAKNSPDFSYSEYLKKVVHVPQDAGAAPMTHEATSTHTKVN
jgi:hypothetical protein